MSKKKLITLPLIVMMIVAVMGVSVIAAGSATSGFKVYQNNGSTSADDVTSNFTGTSAASLDLSSVSGLQAEVKKVNSKLKLSDFKLKQSVDINGSTGTAPWRVVLTGYKTNTNEVCIMLHKEASGSYEYKVFKGTGNYAAMTNVNGFSPFYLYAASTKSSAQTGDFAPAYIAMISVALLSCGVIFAIRAKKATK